MATSRATSFASHVALRASSVAPRASSARRAFGAAPMSASDRRKLVEDLASRPSTPLSLQDMYNVGEARDAVSAATFLHGELPIRMAQRIEELRDLLGAEGDSIIDYYEAATAEIASCAPPATAGAERDFAATVTALLSDRTSVPVALAAAIRKLHPFELDRVVPARRLALDRDLARFFTARIGLRLLIEHYLALREPGQRGLIDPRCMPGDVVSAAAYDVERLARETYGASPAIAVVGDLDASLTYVRTHMREAVGELLKNAVRATLEKHGDGSPLPDVRVVVASGASEITIKVGDEGGGCPRSTRHDMWSWFWSSAAAPARRPLDDGRAVARSHGATLSGMGIGLPMTRCLARYFGGELALRPLEGHGTDAYLHLTVLGDEQCEHLPPAARLSPGELDSTMSEAYAYFDERVR